MPVSEKKHFLFRFTFDHFLSRFCKAHQRPTTSPKRLPNPRSNLTATAYAQSTQAAILPRITLQSRRCALTIPRNLSTILANCHPRARQVNGHPMGPSPAPQRSQICAPCCFHCLDCLEWRPTLLWGKRGKEGTGLSLPGTERTCVDRFHPSLTCAGTRAGQRNATESGRSGDRCPTPCSSLPSSLCPDGKHPAQSRRFQNRNLS